MLLYKGTTSASFIMVGNSPWVIDLLKTSTSAGVNGSMISFSKILLILSWPLLALDGNLDTMFFISWAKVEERKRLVWFHCRSFR